MIEILPEVVENTIQSINQSTNSDYLLRPPFVVWSNYKYIITADEVIEIFLHCSISLQILHHSSAFQDCQSFDYDYCKRKRSLSSIRPFTMLYHIINKLFCVFCLVIMRCPAKSTCLGPQVMIKFLSSSK